MAREEANEPLTLDRLEELKERALAEYRASEARRHAEVSARRQQRAESVRNSLARKLRAVLGLTVDPATIEIAKPDSYIPTASVRLDRWNVTEGRRSILYFESPCPDCEGSIRYMIESLGDFGRLLAGEASPDGSHEHWFTKGSTHPNAPPPWQPDEVVPTEPTIEERLLDAIRDLIRNEIPGGY